jgi:glycosyltransferase involved in cell wall biosynthesis
VKPVSNRAHKTLIIIPSAEAPQARSLAMADKAPMPDYCSLQDAMNADLLSASNLTEQPVPLHVRLAARASTGLALALLAYGMRKDYDIMFSNAENIGIPLALLFRLSGRSPVHAMIGHRLTAIKKRLLLKAARSRIDCVFVYSAAQQSAAMHLLNCESDRVPLIPFHADHRFFRPICADKPPADAVPGICSAGLEWRDYPTLIRAAAGLNVQAVIAAHSPWSKHKSGINGEELTLPPSVHVKQYDSDALRTVYSQAAAVVVPLKENDFQAGITVILEAMAMGRPVITTRTAGMAPGLIHNQNCILVPPADAEALRNAIQWTVDNPDEAEKMGARACAMLTADGGMTLDQWTARISQKLTALADCGRRSPNTAARE